MKRPSFQFYPGDWTGNSNLRRCTHAEKGAWLDIMCLMHDQEEYGVLRWPLREIALAAGCPVALVKALVSKGVLKGDDAELTEAFVYTPRSGRRNGDPVDLITTQAGPIWYSSRMVKDEYVRTIRGEGSRFGEGNDAASKPTPKKSSKTSPKPTFGDGSSSSSSSSPSGSSEEPDGSPDASASKSEPAASGLTPNESLFQVAVPWLVARGMKDGNARSLLGGAIKQLGAAGAWELASECMRTEVMEPGAWLSKALNERIARQPSRRSGSGLPPSGADRRAAWNAELQTVIDQAGAGPRREVDMGVIDATGTLI
ncbi:hypothetical protein [Achromobacter sp. GD03932]|uniref:hypothetical protein n=1 Tax=Achromobacter sp. GD03932 TaxID=2975407 RepID=UPI00244A14FB|nr:hypothetical protein [Achromobacter sp. GD03932]MDH1299696.1 hypothetical protein [Achromobacter sp. GD03932]